MPTDEVSGLAAPGVATPVTNIAAYRFTPMRDLPQLKARLARQCAEAQLKGTILLSTEGINLFIAGSAVAVDSLLTTLRGLPGLADLTAKVSRTDAQPFRRMLVRIKKEIIAFGVEGIDPAQHTSPKLPPRELKRWLDEGRPVVLLDTRNDYEVKLGTFDGARTLGIDHFRDFPRAVRALPGELKDAPIVMFCTGGIRCEKAGPFMEREGFGRVFQLDGGILKYFEDCGAAHYSGECFVFDQRVGVDPALEETDSTQCFHCQEPLSTADQADPRYVAGVSCPACHRTPDEQRLLDIAARRQRIRAICTPLPGSIAADQFKPINVPLACDGATLLDALCAVVKQVPASTWESACRAGRILDDAGRALSAAHRVRAGERYRHRCAQVIEPDVNADIDILYEDDALIVVNKPAPLPMHGGGRYQRNTLQYILEAAYRPQKPRAAHRLDGNTTGLVLLTRTRAFAARLQPQFARGEIDKRYLARILGTPSMDAFDCRAPISAEAGPAGTRRVDADSGIDAHTAFTVLRRLPDGTSLVEARPTTGRTNQIRLHLAHLGWPIVGDRVYGSGPADAAPTLSLADPPLMLHAWKIAFTHPQHGGPMHLSAPPPAWAMPGLTGNHAALDSRVSAVAVSGATSGS